MWRIAGELLEKDRLQAVQEGLIGFLVDEMINPHGEFHYYGHSISKTSGSMIGDPKE